MKLTANDFCYRTFKPNRLATEWKNNVRVAITEETYGRFAIRIYQRPFADCGDWQIAKSQLIAADGTALWATEDEAIAVACVLVDGLQSSASRRRRRK